MPTKLAREIVAFWEDIGPAGWYAGDAAVDEQIASRYRDAWEEARRSGLRAWLGNPQGALAYLLVTDQFSRQLFRDHARAFSTDALARSAARICIDRKMDPLPGSGVAEHYVSSR